MKAWDGSQLPSSDLLPETNLAISSEKDAPNAIIQFTTFACGSTSIVISITHCFADATAMSQFAKDWSLTSRALLSGEPLPALTPIFDPQLLDALAVGNIDAPTPDPKIQKKARSLPIHRYDGIKKFQDSPSPLASHPISPSMQNSAKVSLYLGINGIRQLQFRITYCVSLPKKSSIFSSLLIRLLNPHESQNTMRY
jgi:hypothetical protein